MPSPRRNAINTTASGPHDCSTPPRVGKGGAAGAAEGGEGAKGAGAKGEGQTGSNDVSE